MTPGGSHLRNGVDEMSFEPSSPREMIIEERAESNEILMENGSCIMWATDR